MRLTKRKDGSEWIIDCQHGIGRAFSRFFFHLVNKICMWSDEYELYDKKVLDDSGRVELDYEVTFDDDGNMKFDRDDDDD